MLSLRNALSRRGIAVRADLIGADVLSAAQTNYSFA
jgi:hypothetical protein